MANRRRLVTFFPTWRSTANYGVNYATVHARKTKIYYTQKAFGSPLRFFASGPRGIIRLNDRVNYTNAQLRIRWIFIATRPRLVTIFLGADARRGYRSAFVTLLRVVYRPANPHDSSTLDDPLSSHRLQLISRNCENRKDFYHGDTVSTSRR